MRKTRGRRDERAGAAWRRWLDALATDAESALACALAYESLDGEARDAWLDALREDAANVAAPKVALYAPLASVETDPARRARIWEAMREDAKTANFAADRRAFRCSFSSGARGVVVLSPLYLDFVDLFMCVYDETNGIDRASIEPLVRVADAESRARAWLGEDSLTAARLDDVVDDLAHAILASRRGGRAVPKELTHAADLFSARLAEPS